MLSSLLINIVLAVPARTVKQEKEIKVSKQEKNKQNYLSSQIGPYILKFSTHTHTSLELTDKFSEDV